MISFRNYLTNTDVTIRTRCVRLIGEVLHQIPNTQLSRNEGKKSFENTKGVIRIL
jgi:hypothetical protein